MLKLKPCHKRTPNDKRKINNLVDLSIKVSDANLAAAHAERVPWGSQPPKTLRDMPSSTLLRQHRAVALIAVMRSSAKNRSQQSSWQDILDSGSASEPTRISPRIQESQFRGLEKKNNKLSQDVQNLKKEKISSRKV
jgi:hypothetical protein